MNIGIAHIALKNYHFSEALDLATALSFKGIEIAPTLLWDDPISSTKNERRYIKELCCKKEIVNIGLQSILHNRLDLQIFDTLTARKKCSEYVKGIIQLCADLGGSIVTFGAAKNRRRDILPLEEAFPIALSFFSSLVDTAKNAGVFLCIEPISPSYECDFITTAEEGAKLVRLVRHPNFRLLLDTGSMMLNGESCEDMIIQYADVILHMHINDPYLSFPGAKGINHFAIADALRKINYNRWLTLEFLAGNSSLEDSVAYSFKCYSN